MPAKYNDRASGLPFKISETDMPECFSSSTVTPEAIILAELASDRTSSLTLILPASISDISTPAASRSLTETPASNNSATDTPAFNKDSGEAPAANSSETLTPALTRELTEQPLSIRSFTV